MRLPNNYACGGLSGTGGASYGETSSAGRPFSGMLELTLNEPVSSGVNFSIIGRGRIIVCSLLGLWLQSCLITEKYKVLITQENTSKWASL